VHAKRRRIVQEQQKERGGREGWRKGADGRNLGTKAKVAERDRQIEREREKQKESPTLRGREEGGLSFSFFFSNMPIGGERGRKRERYGR